MLPANGRMYALGILCFNLKHFCASLLLLFELNVDHKVVLYFVYFNLMVALSVCCRNNFVLFDNNGDVT